MGSTETRSPSAPQCRLCAAGRAELSGRFPFSLRERLFNLKIIECGKCWIRKLFTGFPFLFLPLAVPGAGGGVLWVLREAGEPRAANVAAVMKGAPGSGGLGRVPGWLARGGVPSGCAVVPQTCPQCDSSAVPRDAPSSRLHHSRGLPFLVLMHPSLPGAVRPPPTPCASVTVASFALVALQAHARRPLSWMLTPAHPTPGPLRATH